MNIDDLKDTWKNDDTSFKYSPLDAALQRKTSSAISKVRNNMKTEFITTLFSYVILFWFLFSKPKAMLFLNVTCITLCALVILNCFYFFKFYMFYRGANKYDQSVKEGIGKIVYELELNTELYKTYNVCITPLTIIVALGIIWDGQATGYIYKLLTNSISAINMSMIILVMLISFIASYFFIGLHVKRSYQKHLDELKSVLKQITGN
ncbi:hypothetical protein [Mucilaginibacter sp.]|jgi:hypothetical protein|uniref:hypothetical protein n=1 Tax=Mucilaginibacter sp. TaxID=1882438 RepID=UPI0035647577